MVEGAVSSLRTRLRGLCPNCGYLNGLVDHGGGRRECLICGYDSGRDRVQTPGEWLREAKDAVGGCGRPQLSGLRWVWTSWGWGLTGRQRR